MKTRSKDKERRKLVEELTVSSNHSGSRKRVDSVGDPGSRDNKRRRKKRRFELMEEDWGAAETSTPQREHEGMEQGAVGLIGDKEDPGAVQGEQQSDSPPPQGGETGGGLLPPVETTLSTGF